MNAGGGSDRDDFGLPPIGIDVPDDARDLDREVHAYHRELRALRRQRRRQRWVGPLSRDRMILPMLASCLMLALIAGTLLTVFTAAPGGELVPRQRLTRPTASATTPLTRVVPANRPLPADTLLLYGSVRVRLGRLARPLVLALAPPHCRCQSALRQLVAQASANELVVYLVGRPAAMPEVRALAAKSGFADAVQAEDPRNVLGTTFAHPGLTALLVGTDGSVGVAADLRPGLRLTAQLGRLGGALPARSPAS